MCAIMFVNFVTAGSAPHFSSSKETICRNRQAAERHWSYRVVLSGSFFFFLSEWWLKMFNNPIGVGKSNRTVGKVSVFIAVWRRKREGEVRSLCSTFKDPTKLITKPFNSSRGLLFTYRSLQVHFASFFPLP